MTAGCRSGLASITLSEYGSAERTGTARDTGEGARRVDVRQRRELRRGDQKGHAAGDSGDHGGARGFGKSAAAPPHQLLAETGIGGREQAAHFEGAGVGDVFGAGVGSDAARLVGGVIRVR